MSEIYVNGGRALYETLKEISSMMVERSNPMKIVYGVVTSVDPLLVFYKHEIILDEDVLIMPEYISRSLCIGDALIMLQKEGGQRYLVIGKDIYQFSKYQICENQYSENIDLTTNQWYNKNNAIYAGSYRIAKSLIESDIYSERRNYQPDFAVYGEDMGLIFSDYPHHIPYGQYHISAELQSILEYGDRLFVSWKGSMPIVMNRIVDTEEDVFEEDEEDNDYMVKLKIDDKEVYLEKCVQYKNKVYVSLEEVLEAYDKLDNDNLSWEKDDIPFYSYGFVYNILKMKRSVMGSDAGLDLVVPRLETDNTAVSSIYKENSKYNDIVNTTISYNSILGSSETVNIPILCINKEIYVLIDGIYSAMEELMLKPRITGNIDKIPAYVCKDIIFNENCKIIETNSVSIDNINGEKITFSKVLYSLDGIYIPLDELKDKCSGTYDEKTGLYQIYVNYNGENYRIKANTLLNKNKIVNRLDNVEIYKQNLSPISFKALKPIEYLFGKVQSKNKSEIHAINLDECFKPEIKNVCIRTFIERYNKSFSSDKYKLKIADYDDSNNNGTVIVLQYGSKKAVFYASNYNMRSNASESTAVLEIAKGKANNKYEIYQAAKTPSGTLIIHNFLLKDAFGINEDNIYHIPGDEFLSTEDAFMMLKKYYSYDGKEGLYNDITGYAIYEYKNDEGKERYIYTFRTPYKSLLNQYFIGTESEKKAIRYYVITDILTSEQIEDIKKAYIYTGITLYYRNSDNEYSILKGNPKKPTFQNSTKELIKLLEGEPFLTPRMNDNGTITIGYGYDFTKEDDLETYNKYFGVNEKGETVVIRKLTEKEADESIKKAADYKGITQNLDDFMNGKGGGNTVKELTLNQNQYDALFSYFYSNGPFVFDDSNYEAGINAGGKYASRAKARRELRDYIINNNGNYSDERIIQLFVNSKGGSIDFEYKDRRTKEANVFNKK